MVGLLKGEIAELLCWYIIDFLNFSMIKSFNDSVFRGIYTKYYSINSVENSSKII